MFLSIGYIVEIIFEFKERKVKLLAIRIKGYASLWWENLKRKEVRKRGSLFRLKRK